MIGICMKYAQWNYGGTLQAQALCHYMEKKGIDYELIRYVKKDSFMTKIRYIPRIFNSVLQNDKKQRIVKQIEYRKHPEFKKNDQIRRQVFADYAKENFSKLSPEFVGFRALCAGAERYDAVAVGSDQLWSPAGLPTNFYNLMFVPDGIRKISIASSFGVKDIPWYQRKRTKRFLNRIEYLSLRENRGKEIVKELTGRDVPVIVDPVFLLNREEWEKLIPFQREYAEPYVFAYFLGRTQEHRRQVEAFAKKRGLKIVTLHHVDQYIAKDEEFGDYAPYDITSAQFLNILRGAEFVFTDSFHGAVFSIIHQKEFVVFDRYSSNSSVSKNSRIDSLCENLKLLHRRFSGSLENDVEQVINYKNVQCCIDEMLEKTEEFLSQAFNV